MWRPGMQRLSNKSYANISQYIYSPDYPQRCFNAVHNNALVDGRPPNQINQLML